MKSVSMNPDVVVTDFDRQTTADSSADSLNVPDSQDGSERGQKASMLRVMANLVNACLGCGMLSLPWATAGTSILTAAGLTLVVLILNAGTIMILVFASDRLKVYNMGALFRKMPGRWGKLIRGFCDGSLGVVGFITLISFLNVASTSLASLLMKFGVERSFCVWIAVCIVLPLCFLDQRHLAFSSALSIASSVYLTGLVISIFLTGSEEAGLESDRCVVGIGMGSFAMTSILAQAVCMQIYVLPMYEQLERRSPQRFAACLGGSFGFVFILFTGFSTVAYLTFGSSIHSNVLLDLPETSSAMLARLGLGVTVLSVYPMTLGSMVAPIRHSEERAARRERVFRFPSPATPAKRSEFASPSPYDTPARRGAGDPLLGGDEPRTSPFLKPSTVAKLLCVFCSGLVAMHVPDLGSVLTLNGALSEVIFVSLIPGLVGMFLIGGEWTWQACMVMLIVWGASMSVVGLNFTDNSVDDLSRNCMWAVAPQ
eukprot:gnl/TRDRNA2_/TRDRNA2_158519_c0_seq2.p1 gnl/TRDRNA2_/TRDRNA2_158519_c0~~gnl/TRDRNA2_/TRDRNA2_158519_c0_seq2.p1  ORF type:complete len:484 (+),score=50.15 gnl/TRDRNA2_/TRDRNA2_158519_c0_seq2:158-1609(+)